MAEDTTIAKPLQKRLHRGFGRGEHDASRNTTTARDVRCACSVCCCAHLACSTDLPEGGIFAVAWDIDHGAARQPASVVVRRSSGMAEFTGISARHAVTISCFGSCRLRRDVWAEWAAKRA